MSKFLVVGGAGAWVFAGNRMMSALQTYEDNTGAAWDSISGCYAVEGDDWPLGKVADDVVARLVIVAGDEDCTGNITSGIEELRDQAKEDGCRFWEVGDFIQ